MAVSISLPPMFSELLARLGTIGKTKINKVYDPACGSGSLLLKVEKVLGKDNIERGFYGQEIDLTTYNLCRINMFLHNIEFDKFSIVREDTLLSPQHWDDQPFELIVSNPPFSVPWEGDKNVTLINDPRFAPAGVLAPASKGDMAFIMHSLSWLANNGAAAIVCFPGIMYRGGAEQKIRKYLVDNNFVDAIIQLPSNLFLNVTISVDIMLLKKNKTDNAVLFVDASKEFVKVTKNNRLSDDNIQRIVSAVAERKDEQHFARLVPNDEVGSKQNNYNLSVSTYVEQEDGTQTYNDGSEFAGLSSGSNNYAPSNPALTERVEADLETFLEKNPEVKEEDIPTDLLTASGSGLDPHISPDSAEIQIPRIVEASGLSEEEVREIIDRNTEGKTLGVFGEDKVNVLLVNIEIAQAMGLIPASSEE